MKEFFSYTPLPEESRVAREQEEASYREFIQWYESGQLWRDASPEGREVRFA